MSDVPDGPVDDVTVLVDRNGLVELFANRVRARVIVTLFYAEDPLPASDVASHAGIDDSAAVEALEALAPFDLLEVTDGDPPRYAIDRDDDLVAEIRSLAESATNRLYDDGAA